MTSFVSLIFTRLLTNYNLKAAATTSKGWYKRWTFSDSMDKRARFVTLPSGSFRVNSTNFDKISQVTVSNIAQKIPKITLVSIMKVFKIVGCNSEYFWRYSLSNFLFYMAFLPSRLKWLPLKYHIYTLYTDRGLKLAILTNCQLVTGTQYFIFCYQNVSTCNHLFVISSRKWRNVHLCMISRACQGHL